MNGANDFLNDSGSVTECVLGSKTGGIAVGVDERLGDRALGQPGDLGEHLAGGVGVQIACSRLAERLVDAEHLEQVELLVADVALVVAHGLPPR